MIETITLQCKEEVDTAGLAQTLSRELSRFLKLHPSNHINIALEGDLGAGKTTFSRYLIQGMGHVGRVKSPTYTLCEPYAIECTDSINLNLYHFDLYRIQDPLEWQEAGFAEHFDTPGVCLVEWPEKAEGTLPSFDLELQLQAGKQDCERTIQLNALSDQGRRLLASLHPTT